MLAIRIVCFALISVSVAALLGCGNGTNLPGETGRVTGRVIYGSGTIPAGSTVVMLHQGSGIPAIGLTDSSGSFTMEMRNGPDVLVGDYIVSITPPGEIDDNVVKITPATVPEAWNKVPQKYWYAKTSGETFTVAPGNNFYEFTLVSP